MLLLFKRIQMCTSWVQIYFFGNFMLRCCSGVVIVVLAVVSLYAGEQRAVAVGGIRRHRHQ